MIKLLPALPFLPFSPFIPPILALTKPEKHLYNFNIQVEATLEAKTYRFTLGNRSESRSIDIEVAAGKALGLPISDEEAHEIGYPEPLYKDRHVTMTIDITDISPNQDLVEGFKRHLIHLSEREDIVINHRSPLKGTLKAPQNELADVDGDAGEWSTIIHNSFKVAKCALQKFPILPFGEQDHAKANGDFIQVLQIARRK